MLKVAITGNIASGKTAVENILRQKSYQVLDSDDVVHKLHEDEVVKKQIIETFPGINLLEDNKISRKKLGECVFKDEALRKKLEDIIHPLVKDEIQKFLAEQEKNPNNKVVFVSVPLLFEVNFQYLFDKVILVYADDKVRLERLMNRNGLTEEKAKNRIEIQISQDEKTTLADYVIYNDKTLQDLNNKVEEVLKLL